MVALATYALLVAICSYTERLILLSGLRRYQQDELRLLHLYFEDEGGQNKLIAAAQVV
jgi:hypothetical protein